MDTLTKPVSLREHVVPVEAGAHVVAAHWLKQTLALALADGRVLRWREGATESRRGPCRRPPLRLLATASA